MRLNFSCVTCKEETILGDLCVFGEIILKWILTKQCARMWTAFTGSGQCLVVGCCEHGNEPLGSQQAGNFLTSRASHT
jgi:hypothetical protein